MKPKNDAEANLETSLEELNGLIHKMEKGDISLEESLIQFERGVKLIGHCQKILHEAEQKVQILLEKNGSLNLENFENKEE